MARVPAEPEHRPSDTPGGHLRDTRDRPPTESYAARRAEELVASGAQSVRLFIVGGLLLLLLVILFVVVVLAAIGDAFGEGWVEAEKNMRAFPRIEPSALYLLCANWQPGNPGVTWGSLAI
jgi:hypothetical protein